MEVSIDTSLCSACELCCDLCPEVFEMGDDGYATVLKNPVPAELEDDVRDAADSCSSGAIMISE
ncbi:MAG: ferredoxin [Anaerolineae bacterium]|nr:ferredoxin [Anaerolineae bacterium]